MNETFVINNNVDSRTIRVHMDAHLVKFVTKSLVPSRHADCTMPGDLFDVLWSHINEKPNS